MVVCVNCGLEVPTLYHVYNNTNFCLATCVHCGKISDKYVEWELPLLIIDLFLFKIEVYRHLIHNHSHRPFTKAYNTGLRIKNNTIKVILLLISSIILDSYSMLTTCNYLTSPAYLCYPEFESYNEFALSKISKYFSNPFSSKRSISNFKFKSIDESLEGESSDSVTDLLQNMASTMMYHSRLNIFKRRGRNDEYCKRKYSKTMELLFLLFLQNPTLCSWSKNMTADCQDISELGIISLSTFRVISYCLYIALFYLILKKFGVVKPIKTYDNCKCNNAQLHLPKISYTNIFLAILLCFHIKSLVLMINIWYTSHTILIVIEFYIYFSNIVELNAICNISYFLSAIMTITGALLKFGVYFVWFHFVNTLDLFYFYKK